MAGSITRFMVFDRLQRMNRRHFVFSLSGTPLLARTSAPELDLEWVDAKSRSPSSSMALRSRMGLGHHAQA